MSRLAFLSVIPLGVLAGIASGQATYVGAGACAKCHAAEFEKWSHARHGKMLQPAAPASVEGDFTVGAVRLRGATYRLREQAGVYYITESFLSGKEQEHRIDYTLGSRRIQHYLTTLPDGRIILLPPSWDVLRKQWFHNIDIVNPEESNRVLLQLWNKNCFGCHVSREEKGFNPASGSYDTRWADFGTNCERCHGPGSEHVDRYRQPVTAQGPSRDIVLQTRLDATRNTMVCAQCHSLRDLVNRGYTAGANYYDFFLPILEYAQKVDSDPAYWSDGRPRRFSNDTIGFWQSQCFLKGGATCLGCHQDVHDPEVEKNAKLRPGANAICIQCHGSIGERVEAHTHHAANSPGSACVECHMPRTVFSIKAAIRDHSISIPAPENTVRFQIPNACNVCHTNHDAKWALRQTQQWYGDGSGQKYVRRAEAFSQARAGNRASIQALLGILSDPSEGFLMRANAAGHLSRFSDDARVLKAMEVALADPEPLIRAVAALRIQPGGRDPNEIAAPLARALGDPIRTVRISAALSFANLGLKPISTPLIERFEVAKKEIEARYQLSPDDPDEQLNAGRFYYLMGESESALAAFRAVEKLDPQQSTRYFIGCALVQEGRFLEARKQFSDIPYSDPYYADAQKMSKAIAGK